MSRTELERRAQAYADRYNLVLGKKLGFGVHGSVFAAENQAQGGRMALKVHEREVFYCRERDAYRRLLEHEVTDVRGCSVPELLAHDDELWALEMTVVSRPFVLDFAGAYLDLAPDFSEEVLADWQAQKQEEFGPRWPEVQAILGALEAYGVFLVDVNPGNVSFGD